MEATKTCALRVRSLASAELVKLDGALEAKSPHADSGARIASLPD